MYVGVLACVLALSKVHARFIAPEPYSWHNSSRFAWSLAYVGLQCLVAYGVGLPDLVRSRRSAWTSALTAAAGGALAISAVQLLVGDALLPRFVVFGSALALVPGYYLSSAWAQGSRARSAARDQVLFVGDAQLGAQLETELRGDVEQPAEVAAVLRTTEARPSAERPRPLVEAAIESGATVVVLSGAAREDDDIVAQVATLHEQGFRVRTLSLFYEEWLGKLPVSDLERVSLMFDIGELHRVRYARLKRLVDVPLAIVGFVPFGLSIPFVLVGNVFGSRGPLFFSQDRVGKDGHTFRIVKFRTMVATAEAAGEWTAANDPRITRFGRFLRLSHIDELPQVINILKGDLALVGPRPEQPHYVTDLREKLPFYDLRHLVHPGLTGWAQVKYGYAGDERDALEKLQYEFYYLRHQSMSLDLRILGRTVRSVLGRGGR
jgi:lipopolysaccharide/colanic/teichoic acid biosynthesis glycosyltransferase